MMTEEILGPLDQEIQELEDQGKLIAKKRKELEDKKQLCNELEIDVIKELEKKYDFEGYRKNMSQFCDKLNDFLLSLDNHLNKNSKESKKVLLEKIPPLRELAEFIKNFEDG